MAPLAKRDVDDEVVLLGVIRGHTAAQSVAVHFLDVPEKPAQQVDRVAGPAEDQVLRHGEAPRRVVVHRPQVVDVVGFAEKQLADFPGVAGAPGLHQVVAPAHRLRNQEHQPRAVDRLDDLFDLRHGVDHRLGDHHVLACVEGLEDLLRVQRSRGVDADDVEVVPRHDLVVLRSRMIDSVLPGDAFQELGPGLAQGGHPHRQIAPLRVVGPEKGASVAESGHADSQLAHGIAAGAASSGYCGPCTTSPTATFSTRAMRSFQLFPRRRVVPGMRCRM